MPRPCQTRCHQNACRVAAGSPVHAGPHPQGTSAATGSAQRGTRQRARLGTASPFAAGGRATVAGDSLGGTWWGLYSVTSGENNPGTWETRPSSAPRRRSPSSGAAPVRRRGVPGRPSRRAEPAAGQRRGGASRDPPLPYQKSRRRRARRAAQRQRPVATRDAALPPSCTAPGPAWGREEEEEGQR